MTSSFDSQISISWPETSGYFLGHNQGVSQPEDLSYLHS